MIDILLIFLFKQIENNIHLPKYIYKKWGLLGNWVIESKIQ